MLRSRNRKESEVFGWSRNRIPNNVGNRSWSESDFFPTPDVQLDHILYHNPKLGFPVEIVQFLWEL